MGLRKVYPGDQPSARNFNTLMQQVNELCNVQQSRPLGDPRPAARQHHFLAEVINHGPDGEADYTDERYWVREAYCSTAAGDGTANITFGTSTKTGRYWVTATNLAELGMAAGRQHTLLSIHATTPYVMVYCVHDNQNPPLRHYYFYSHGCPDVQIADGLTYIRNDNPGVNYDGANPVWAIKDVGGLETCILIHFTNIVNVAESLVVFTKLTTPSAFVSGPGVGGFWSQGRFEARHITADFNPATVTWATRPPTAGTASYFRIHSRALNAGEATEGTITVHDISWGVGGLMGTFGFEIRPVLMTIPFSTTRTELAVRRESPLLILPGVATIL